MSLETFSGKFAGRNGRSLRLVAISRNQQGIAARTVRRPL